MKPDDSHRDLLAHRSSLAEEWRATAAKVDGSTPEFVRGTTLKTRLMARYLQGTREDRRRALRRQFAVLGDRLVMDSVGATPGVWGVFSAAPPDPGAEDDDGFQVIPPWNGCSLEMTLKHVMEQPTVRLEAEALLVALPAFRVSAALDGPEARSTVEDAVVQLAGTCTQDPDRQLLEHLPLRRRPRVKTLEDLNRRNSVVTLFLSQKDMRWRTDLAARSTITLHDVVVDAHLRGQGLGTVVLGELCRLADETGQNLTGMLEPGPTKPASSVPPLARWYAGFGFRVDGQPDPADWARRSTMDRSPSTPV